MNVAATFAVGGGIALAIAAALRARHGEVLWGWMLLGAAMAAAGSYLLLEDP